MADTLQPINPLEYIKPHDPVPQQVRNASRWFAVETMEITFGDYTGRPSAKALIRVQFMNYLFAEGWYVDAVYNASEGGSWKSVGTTDNQNSGGSQTSTHSNTVGKNNSNSTSASSSVVNSNNASSTTGQTQSNTTGQTSSSTTGQTQNTTAGQTQNATSGSTASSTTGTNQNATTGQTGNSTSSSSTSTSLTLAAGEATGVSSSNASSTSSSTASSIPWGDDRMAQSSGSANSTSIGNSSSSTQEESNSTTNGTSNSITNGTSNSTTSGMSNSTTNGTSNSTTNGTSNSTTNGTSNSATNGTSNSTTNGTSNSTTNGTSSSATDSTNSSSSTGTNQSTTNATGNSTTNGTNNTNTIGNSSSDTTSDSSTLNSGSSSSTTESEGPYWYAYTTIRMKRRKLQSELVMKDMVEDLTKAYNEGRKVNDERYDEIVSLYSIMLGRTETEGNGFIVQTADIKPLTDSVLASMKKTINDFHAVADNLADDVFKNRVKQINLKFDNELSTARSTMITAGLYNSTVWITTSAGIERNREMALNDLIETKIDVYVKVANAGNEIGKGFMDSAAKIQAMAKERLLDPTTIRNNVFKWMLDFMERRKDEFPSLDQVAGAAKQFGTGDTNVSNGVK